MRWPDGGPDGAVGDFDWSRTTALSADSLRGVFREEPSYVDLRPVRELPRHRRSQVFRDLVADLAAPLHHRPKDDLVGDEHRILRRAEVDWPARCIATGGLAPLIATETRTIEATDDLLTLKGLKILYHRNA